MRLVLFTIGCPKCNTLEKKLEKEGFTYETDNNMSEVAKAGFQSAPVLKVIQDNGESKLYDFNAAIRWINENK